MKQYKKEMKSGIVGRLVWLWVIVVLFVCLPIIYRVVYIQFFTPTIAVNAKNLEKSIIVRDTLYARRGGIYTADDKPLALSIIRKEILLDIAADGCDNREKFFEQADTLSRCLESYFGDKSAADYFKALTCRYDSRAKITIMGYDTIIEQSRLSKLWHKITGKRVDKSKYDYTIKPIENIKRRHTRIRIFRAVDMAEWEEIKKFPLLNGSCGDIFITQTHDTRIYPYGELARRTIGKIDVQRPYGLEEAYKDSIAGRGGWQWSKRIAPGFKSKIWGNKEYPYQSPTDGCDIYTTLDIEIQEVADMALKNQLKAEGAIWGTTMVMEVATGNLIALVNLGKGENGDYIEDKNYALGSRLEPGSTFKVAVAMALLDDAKVSPHQTYDSGRGQIVKVGAAGTKIQDSHYIGRDTHGIIDMRTAFKESANVYFTKAVYNAYEHNPQRYVDFLRGLHLAEPMGLSELGEISPRLPDPATKKYWYPHTTLVNLGYGYGLELAPIQTLTLYNAVANGGKMVAPRLITRIERDGQVVEQIPIKVLKDSLCSKKTLKILHSFLEAVGLEGTAKGYFGADKTIYRVGAKTGTAKVAQGGIKYADGYYLASMVTYLPAENPKYTLMTAVFKRRGVGSSVYGAGVAGPVQKAVATYLYNRSNTIEYIPTADIDVATKIKGGDIGAVKVSAENVGATIAGSVNGLYAVVKNGDKQIEIEPIEEDKTLMPSVIGMGLQDAIYVIENSKLSVTKVTGQGKVIEQSITAATPIKSGEKVELTLGL